MWVTARNEATAVNGPTAAGQIGRQAPAERRAIARPRCATARRPPGVRGHVRQARFAEADADMAAARRGFPAVVTGPRHFEAAAASAAAEDFAAAVAVDSVAAEAVVAGAARTSTSSTMSCCSAGSTTVLATTA